MRAERIAKIVAKVREGLGPRLREFAVEVEAGGSDEKDEFRIVLKGAAGSVTALRGLREKLQPVMKKALRESGGGARFNTFDSDGNGDKIVRVELLFL